MEEVVCAIFYFVFLAGTLNDHDNVQYIYINILYLYEIDLHIIMLHARYSWVLHMYDHTCDYDSTFDVPLNVLDNMFEVNLALLNSPIMNKYSISKIATLLQLGASQRFWPK